MSKEITQKVATDAERLVKCDGPHMRKWMRDDPDGFVAAVHGVAAAALAQREPVLAPASVPPRPAPSRPFSRG